MKPTPTERKPILQSERLWFRLLEDTDFEDLKTLDMDPEVRAHYPDGISTPEKIRESIEKNQKTFAEKGFCTFALFNRASGRFVGRAGFAELDDGEVEVGYILLKEYWGQGVAQEALAALLAWARLSIDKPRIIAYAPAGHVASLNVMKKCGMRYWKTDMMRGVPCAIYEFPLSGRRTL